MKLSEKVEKYRTDRPDEWTMDELLRDARKLEGALLYARSAIRYIREAHGELYGVDFDRFEIKAKDALGEVGIYLNKITESTRGKAPKVEMLAEGRLIVSSGNGHEVELYMRPNESVYFYLKVGSDSCSYGHLTPASAVSVISVLQKYLEVTTEAPGEK